MTHKVVIVAPSYGRGDASLVSAMVLGIPEDEERLQVREQLGDCFGLTAWDWHHLRAYRISYALAQQALPALDVSEGPVRWPPGVYVCWDHQDNASIMGAMVSGRRAADAVLEGIS